MAIVRVAVSNNFNCTYEEFSQLNAFAKDYPEHTFFINSNIKTPNLPALNDYPYKAVITANPDLSVNTNLIRKLDKLDPKKISFLRIKYLPENQDILNLIRDLNHHYNVVLTLQRFNSKATLATYTEKTFYTFSCSRFRLQGPALEKVHDLADNLGCHICDRNNLGCSACGLCASFNQQPGETILSLNLSSSGICKYNCPDCYAKATQARFKCFNNAPIKYNKLYQNYKQRGVTAHIRKEKEHATA